MNPLDEIIDSLIAELELERTLGVRSVEFDRDLLKEPAQSEPEMRPAPARQSAQAIRPAAVPQQAPAAGSPATGIFDFVFLNDSPLSEKASEMMAKIIVALGKNAETAPIVFDGAVPAARVYVILGSRALRKWIPSVKAAAGAWVDFNGVDALVSYSPEIILRFSPDSPDLVKTKKTMWLGLKAAAARARQKRSDSR